MTAFTKTLALTLTLASGAALADDVEFEITGDAAKGERVFRKCKACHQVGEDAANRVGPVLNGIVGRKPGTGADFDYSDVMIAKGDEIEMWSPEELDAFLTKPRDYLDGTKMAFAGLRKEADRQDVIAYLASFQEDGTPAE